MKTCKQCGTEFEPRYSAILHRSDTVYCSDAHRREHRGTLGNIAPQQSTPQQKQLPETPMKKAEIAVPNGLGENANFIIKMVERDRDRFEEAYKEERTTRKKLKEEKEKIEKQFAEFKQQTELEKISSLKPTGLAGLGENPLVNKLIDGIAPHIGPSVGKWLERMMEPGAPGTQLAGGNNNAIAFAQWLETQTPGTQEYILKLLLALSQIPNENDLIQRIAQIESLVMGDYMRKAG